MRKIKGTEVSTFENEISHIRLRPEIHIGSTDQKIGQKWFTSDGFEKLNFNYIPALYKIFDEVISNAVDESIKTNFKGNKIWVGIEDSVISIKDNGRGIPIIKDTVSKRYVPEMVFTDLRTGSNFEDNKNSELLGKNGVGVSLTNIFSTFFEIETASKGKKYQQFLKDDKGRFKKPKISKSTKNYTLVRFIPDYDYFSEKADLTFINIHLPKDCLEMIAKQRVFDLALCYPEITFYWNKKKISTKSREFFLKIDKAFSVSETEKVKLAVMYSDTGFETLSWVNGVDVKGGTHIDYTMSKITEGVKVFIKKKYKVDVKPLEIRNRMILFLSGRFPNPHFDSQTKERITNNTKDFQDRLDKAITDKFIKSICQNEQIIQSIIEVYELKKAVAEKKQVKSLSKSKKKIAKLVPAQSKDKENNILMIAEGDSALNELINVRKSNIGGIPIRGKLLNVYDKKPVDIVSNEELKSLIQAIGLEIGKKAKDLNYGRIGILSDQDHDGNAIAGLLLNFFYKFWPELIEEKRIIRILSPLYIATKGKETKRFYNHSEYQNFMLNGFEGWKIKYNKGLGALGPVEYEYMLNNLKYIEFSIDKETGSMLELVYSQNTDARKEWLI